MKIYCLGFLIFQFLNIPVSKFGTKKNNRRKIKKIENSSSHRIHNIKKLNKNSFNMSEIANRKITDIKNVIARFGSPINECNNININLIAALSVQHEIFGDVDIAKLFILTFKENIFVK